MTGFNVQQRATIDNYRSRHKLGFVLSDEAIVELIKKDMEQTGVVYAGFESLAKSVAKSHIKQPTSNANINVKTNNRASIFGSQNTDNYAEPLTIAYPEIQPTESQREAINFLKDITSDAEITFKNREDEAGLLSATVNAGHEVINWWRKTFENRQNDYAKSTVKKELQRAKEDLQLLERASKGQADYTDFLGNTHIRNFEDVFKQRRGVKFDEKAIADCTEKAEQFAAIKTTVEMINQTKQILGYTTKGDIHSQINPQEASSTIIKAFQLSGINSIEEMNKTLQDIEQKYQNHPDIQKYGGGFKFVKNEQGQYVIYRIAKNGYPAEATNEQLTVIAKEMGLRLDKALATALGVEYNENATPEEMANLTQQTFDKYQKEYEDSFAKAYGKKDVKALSELYVLKQQEGVANIEMSINILSTALMVVPGGIVGMSGMLLKGGKFVQTAQKMAKVGAALTNIQQIASPFVMATMTLRPTELLEQLSSKNGMSAEEWKAWGQGVLQNSIYMAAGMGASKLAQNGAAMYKTKALVNSLKSAGKSTDEIIAMIKANPVKFPNEIVKSFSKIDNIAKALQVTSEVALDLGSTIVLNKVMNNGDLLPMDVINSIAFALMGGVVQKDIAKLNGDVDKIDFILKEFKEFGVTEADAKNILQAMDDISLGKVQAENVEPLLENHHDLQMLDEVVVTVEKDLIKNNSNKAIELDIEKRLELYPEHEVNKIRTLLKEDEAFIREIMCKSDEQGNPIYSLKDMQNLFNLQKEHGNIILDLMNRDMGQPNQVYSSAEIARIIELKKKDPLLIENILKAQWPDGSLRFIKVETMELLFEISAINKPRFEYLLFEIKPSSINSNVLKSLCKMKDSRFNKMVDSGVFELIKEGKISPEILAPIKEHTYMSDKLLRDLKKIKNNEACVPELPSGAKLLDINKHVADGEVCSLAGALYINDNGKAVKLNITPQKYEELFPLVDRYVNRQGYIGDCYLISAFDALMDKPKGKIALLSLFSQEGNDVILKFPNSQIPIVFKDGQVFDANGHQVSGAKGIQMLEQAYFFYRDQNLQKQDMPIDAMARLTDKQQLIKQIGQGGYTSDVIDDIIGRPEPPFNLKTVLKELNPFKSLFSKSTPLREILMDIQNNRGEVISYTCKEPNLNVFNRERSVNSEYDLYSPHAYTLKAYDEIEDMVYLTNPHHTGYITEIPYKILTKYEYSIVRIPLDL